MISPSTSLKEMPTIEERMEQLFTKEWLESGSNWKLTGGRIDFVPIETEPHIGAQLGFDGENAVLYSRGGLHVRVGDEFYYLAGNKECDLTAIGKPVKRFIQKVNSDLPPFIPNIEYLAQSIHNKTPLGGIYFAKNGRDICGSLHRAIWLLHLEKNPLRDLTHKEVSLFAYKDKKYDERAWQMWSDGSITHGHLDDNLHQGAIKLSTIPNELQDMLLYMDWKQIGANERINFVKAVVKSSGQVRTEEKKSSKIHKFGWTSTFNAETTLRLVVAHGYKFYIVDTQWGAMSEDGDSGREVVIKRTLKDAKKEYSKAIGIWHK